MKNIRPKNVTSKSIAAVIVTPVRNASSGSRWSNKKGADERTLTRSSADRRMDWSMESSTPRSLYLPVGREPP
jgi:hypothetical protein